MKTKYTNKQIWMIAYPILISLLMEQMIGMTDTAFLGRVDEVELGASAIAGVFYMVIYLLHDAMENSNTRKSETCSTRAYTSR